MKIFIIIDRGCVSDVFTDYVGKVEVEIVDQDDQDEREQALKREDEIAAMYAEVG